MPTVTLRWRGSTDAVSGDAYKIETDLSVSGTFATLVASQAATSPYDPNATTLSGALTASATSLTLADATDFVDGDYILVDREMILLAGKSGSTFSGVTRGVGGTLPIAHADGATVYEAHESYSWSPSFGSRNLFRARIIFIDASESNAESVAAEVAVISPTAPPTNNLVTVFGILTDSQGGPVSGATVQIVLSEGGAYSQDSGETLRVETESTTTDADGYWELYTPPTAAFQGAVTRTLTVDVGGSSPEVATLGTVPEVTSIHYKRVI